MKTNKLLIGGLIGGIAYFLLGWIIYGMILMPIMKSHTISYPGLEREMPMFLILFAGNLAYGFLLTYAFGKMQVKSLAEGATNGAIIGALMALTYDLTMYSMYMLMDKYAVLIDILAATATSAILGALIGWYLNMGKKAE